MLTNDFWSCCGLKVIHGFMVLSSPAVPMRLLVQSEVLTQLQSNCKSYYTGGNTVGVLIALNAGQRKSFHDGLIDLGCEVVKEFKNFNDHYHDLTLYYRPGEKQEETVEHRKRVDTAIDEARRLFKEKGGEED